MTTALYRRYRPDTFDQVIGQNHVTDPLRAALRANRITHAYLFSGPRGCGKTTCARILARCLNCAEGPTDTPCGKCESCIELATGGTGSLDVVEIDAASHNGVDDARELRERAAFAPVRDKYKIFILDEAHMVTAAGFNALLKLVEEPPDHVKFIFATTEPEKVIGTIRSRTHSYPFRLVPPEILEPFLRGLCAEEGIEVGEGVLPLVIRAGGGSVRDTLSVLDQLMAGAVDSTLEYHQTVALLGYTDATLLDTTVDALAARNGEAAFGVVERMIESGHEPRRFVEDLLQRLRDILIIAVAGEQARDVFPDVPADQLERMIAQAREWGPAAISGAADLTDEALRTMVGATSPRLQVELLMGRILLQGTAAPAGAAQTPPGAPVAAPAGAPVTQAQTAPAQSDGGQGSFGAREALRALREKQGKAPADAPVQSAPEPTPEPAPAQRPAPATGTMPVQAQVPATGAVPVQPEPVQSSAQPQAQTPVPAPVPEPAATPVHGEPAVQHTVTAASAGNVAGQWEAILARLEQVSRVAGAMVRQHVKLLGVEGDVVMVDVPTALTPRFESDFKPKLEDAIQQVTGTRYAVSTDGSGPSGGPGGPGPSGGTGGPSGPAPGDPVTGQAPVQSAPPATGQMPVQSTQPATGQMPGEAARPAPEPVSEPAVEDDPFATGWGPVAVPGGGAAGEAPASEPTTAPEPEPSSSPSPAPASAVSPVESAAPAFEAAPAPAPAPALAPAPEPDQEPTVGGTASWEPVAVPDAGMPQGAPVASPAPEPAPTPEPEPVPAPDPVDTWTPPAQGAPRMQAVPPIEDEPPFEDHGPIDAPEETVAPEPAGPSIAAADDTTASMDDDDAADSPEVGLPAVLEILGGTVIEETTNEGKW